MNYSELEKKKEKITVRFSTTLLERAKQKADKIPLSRIIRILLDMWLNGEIKIK
jgi:predicted DNA binding CopG/RHH family protein